MLHFQENHKANFLWICMAGIILLSYALGVLISQPEIPLSMNGVLTKLSGDSAFTLMSLLGASMMPHNFYLHSSIVRVFLSPFSKLPSHAVYLRACLCFCLTVHYCHLWSDGYGLKSTRIDLYSTWEDSFVVISFSEFLLTKACKFQNDHCLLAHVRSISV